MFGPLGFVPGLTPEQNPAAMGRGGWAAAGVPTVEHYAKVGAVVRGSARGVRRLPEIGRAEIPGTRVRTREQQHGHAPKRDARAARLVREGGQARLHPLKAAKHLLELKMYVWTNFAASGRRSSSAIAPARHIQFSISCCPLSSRAGSDVPRHAS